MPNVKSVPTLLLVALAALFPACQSRDENPTIAQQETAGSDHAVSGAQSAEPSPLTEAEAEMPEPRTDDFGDGTTPLPHPTVEHPTQRQPQSNEFPRPTDVRGPQPAPSPAAHRDDDVEDVEVVEAPSFGDRNNDETNRDRPNAEDDRLTSVTIPVGTTFAAALDDTLSSETAKIGDPVTATIGRDVVVDGHVVIPAGSVVRGQVTEAVGLRRVGGQARLAFDFDEVRLPGRTVPIETTFARVGRSETGRDAATIGGSAAAGAVLGRILNDNDRDRGTLIGAAAGAVIGTVIASRTAGEPVEVPAGTEIEIALDQPVSVQVR